MTAIRLQNEQHWHELRAKNIGGSEVAALFGESSFMTKFELWHRKAGNLLEPDLSNNSRVFWGKQLESSIAQGIAQLKGWTIRNVDEYLTSQTIEGMAASLDYEIDDSEKGTGVLEIKNVDGFQFLNWPDNKPPLSYQLQLQHQLAVSGHKWGVIAVLVGGNDPKEYYFDRHDEAIAAIEHAIQCFWVSIANGEAPSPDFYADSASVMALNIHTGTEIIHLEDEALAELCARYCAASEQEKQAKNVKDATKAEAITKIGDASEVFVGNFKIKTFTGKSTEKRKASRTVRITEVNNEQ